jgi:hypothetical protein
MRVSFCAAALCMALGMIGVARAEYEQPDYSCVPGVGSAKVEATASGGLGKAAGKAAKSDNGLGGRSVGAQAGHYFLSRWYDLIDTVDFSVGGGPGFLINVRATKLAQAIGGYSDAYRVGFRGRSAGFWREKRKEIGVSLLYYQHVERERITGWVESFRSDKMDLDTSTVFANNNDRSFLGIGATVHVLVLVDVNVRPMQALDFALGWFTIDVLEDDTGKPRRNKDL